MKLLDFIFPDMNIVRSVNLERDYEHIGLIEDYQITAKTLEILGRFVDALQGERVSAWSLTGPYGMGKSAFVNYLLAVTGPSGSRRSQIALEKLKCADSKLYRELSSSMSRMVGKAGFFQVPVTAAYEPVNDTLARGLHNALAASELPNKDELIARLESLREQKAIDSQKLFAAFKDTYHLSNRPLLVVVDEFGKNLDYMSHYHDRGDIFIMQQLAEVDWVYLWVCLHQADEYAFGLSTVQRQEWSKVQGRFEDITFVESTAQMLRLMRKVLKQNLQEDQKERLRKWAEEARRFVEGTHMANKQDFDVNTIASLYPIHPLTAIALIELCRQFAQNDRTLLSFMCSRHMHALPAYLEHTEVSGKGRLPAVGLDYLYDYFFNISTTVYSNRAVSQRWVEIQDIIENAVHLSAQDQALLKNIGVLNLLPGNLGVRASLDTISAIMEYAHGLDRKMVKETVESLVYRGILLFREYAGEYRLWEGSDFDVYGALRERKMKLSIGSLDALLQEYLPLSPVIASRHAHKTGTIRRFERRWLDVELLTGDLAPQKGFDGLFLYCFGTLKEPSFVPEVCRDGRPLLVAYVPSQSTLHELALEVAAARSVLEESPELVHDSVARKEVKFRIKVAEQQFREHFARLYSPGSEDVLWYSEGRRIEIHNARELSATLSELCDRYYCKCPRIGNEMISYDHLSSAAARARRELVEAMVTRAGEERLGLRGFGPEVAVYRSLLLAEGLHVKDEETGCWHFSLEGNDPQLKYLWKQIDECINTAGDQGISVANILSVLREPPFGMRQGPAPIYICLYLLVKSDEIAVFQEGTYRPYLTASEMALMLKRPDLFVLKRFVSNNVEREVFDIYKNILNKAQIEGNPGLRNTTMLGVVGPLVKFVNELPAYARNTRQISREAQQLRLAIQNSVEPIRLLFEELPRAVGIDLKAKTGNDSAWREELQVKLRSALYELGQAYHALNAKVQKTMLQVFEGENLQELYKKQRERTKPLLDICDEPELKSVLQAFAREYRDPAEWVKGIAGIVIKKHMDSWNDQDFTLFAAKLRDYADRIRQLETLASLNGCYVKENTRLISIMRPGGKIRREVVNVISTQDAEVQGKVSEILALPEEKSRAILVALAEKIFAGDSNDH
ncbi:hypothetical protein Desku_0565 [Desulfofundulus kuznetsovii DSM 6115]|uniref:ATP-binding protein n=1 Tax=Desulfofundulus kuznetsovii (strain DSM 6115 / VKM B-1805 / 17) TaxID=760568 RepID=A0AAU8PB21_DESK7|nr:hypothetical protein Desku_0565 [Desulfofundulus kuznetsovii DSM 6115]